MADAPSASTPESETFNRSLPQNITSEEGQHRNTFTTGSFNQQNAPSSRSQEPWNVLLYWMSAQYYQQYYYYLTSYMYYWQTIASNSMYQGAFQAQSSFPQSGVQPQGTQAGFSGRQPPNNQQNPPYGGGLLMARAAPWVLQGRQPVRTVCEVQIAPISKRIYAEILDFIFLYFTKVLVFSIFYDDLERYSELQYTLMTDDDVNLKDIEELLMQALVYRLIVFAYEVFFLMGGLHGSVGGATPGKYLMGLSVVATDYVTTVGTGPDGDRVRIEPGGNLGFWRSFVRALVKNFSMTFLFPVFLTILFFQHNRTIYDVIANATVVLTAPAQPRQQHANNR